MQLLGKSLDETLNDLPGPFDLPTVLLLGIQITTLLEVIHSTGFIHRDIKPSNLLLDGGGIVWITDLRRLLDFTDF